jgi:hypothetical protein
MAAAKAETVRSFTAASRPGVAQPLEQVQSRPVVAPGVRPPAGEVLGLEQPAERLPGQAAGLLKEAVIQLVFQVLPFRLGVQRVARLGRPALALAGDGVVPLQHEERAVAHVLHPHDNSFFGHGPSAC